MKKIVLLCTSGWLLVFCNLASALDYSHVLLPETHISPISNGVIIDNEITVSISILCEKRSLFTGAFLPTGSSPCRNFRNNEILIKMRSDGSFSIPRIEESKFSIFGNIYFGAKIEFLNNKNEVLFSDYFYQRDFELEDYIKNKLDSIEIRRKEIGSIPFLVEWNGSKLGALFKDASLNSEVVRYREDTVITIKDFDTDSNRMFLGFFSAEEDSITLRNNLNLAYKSHNGNLSYTVIEGSYDIRLFCASLRGGMCGRIIFKIMRKVDFHREDRDQYFHDIRKPIAIQADIDEKFARCMSKFQIDDYNIARRLPVCSLNYEFFDI